MIAIYHRALLTVALLAVPASAFSQAAKRAPAGGVWEPVSYTEDLKLTDVVFVTRMWEVLLMDRSGNTLHQSVLRQYEVLANDSRTTDWRETASVAAVNQVRAVVIHHSYEPKHRLAASAGWISANSKGVSIALTCTRLSNNEKGAGALRRPTSGTQPGYMALQCSK